MSEPWTVRRILGWMTEDFQKRSLASPRLDAELLIGHALGLGRVQVYLELDRPLEESELVAIRALVARRRAQEPVAYLLGKREFYGRSFEVGKGVLVPRPDTETLVEQALARLPSEGAKRVLDLCTGSGCVAVTIAAEGPELEVHASDLSRDALAIARRNGAALAAGRVVFHEGDLFAAIPAGLRFDVITANPPYIAESERGALPPDVVQHEPAMALFGGRDGLDLVRRIAADARRWLVPGGALLVEIGQGQARETAALFEAGGLLDVHTHRDLGDAERVVSGSAPSP